MCACFTATARTGKTGAATSGLVGLVLQLGLIRLKNNSYELLYQGRGSGLTFLCIEKNLDLSKRTV